MEIRIMKSFTVLACLALPTLVHAQFSYTTNSGAINIDYYTGSGGAVVIPATTNGYPVTSIGDYAFSQSGITSVTIPNSVTNIGLGAFAYCYSLRSAAVPNSVTSIGGNAFQDCSSLNSVTIPDSVISIGDYAFTFCTTLTNITVNVSNPAYSSSSGVLFDKVQATLIQFPTGLGGSYVIPNSVTLIWNEAFVYCVSLTSVTIPNSVTSIGGTAFDHCISLTNVTIGNDVTNIGDSAFGECASLTNVNIPASVTSIGPNAFYYCTSLTSVTISNGAIGVNAFAFCPNLASAYFRGNAPSDDGSVFGGDPAIVYYLYGTTGWGSTFGSRPTRLWNPQANSSGFTSGLFGFNLTGPTNAAIVVEACANLSNPVWLPVGTNTFSVSGTSIFTDPSSGIYPTRYYRFRSP
jgi:BspA type Leucine rich repeat region (6 copies)